MKKPSGMAKTVIIIDECDAVMLRNLLTFYKATEAQNISVIGLTATADAGGGAFAWAPVDKGTSVTWSAVDKTAA